MLPRDDTLDISLNQRNPAARACPRRYNRPGYEGLNRGYSHSSCSTRATYRRTPLTRAGSVGSLVADADGT